MTARLDLIGAILVGGRSSRMGLPKHLLPMPDGRRLIDAVADAMCAVCDRLVVVGSDRSPLEGVVAIPDRRPHAGPLGGIVSLLERGPGDRYLLSACDVPLLTAEPLRALAEAPDCNAAVLHFADNDDLEPLPLRLSARVFDAANEALAREDRSLFAFIRGLRPIEIDAPTAWRPLLRSINTPQEYEALLKHGAAG